jgi:YesN/AraC family two-component response regulator
LGRFLWRDPAAATGWPLFLILSDINMPGMSGLELLPKAKALRPDVTIIMIGT